MAQIWYPFEKFPLFQGRRPVLTKGEAECQTLFIGPGSKDEPRVVVRWQVGTIRLHAGSKLQDKTADDLARDSWLRQDFERWLRGHHGHAIERLLRAAQPHQGDPKADE